MKPFTKICYLFVLLGTLILNVNCKEKTMKEGNQEMSKEVAKTIKVERSDYGVAKSGETVELFSLKIFR